VLLFPFSASIGAPMSKATRRPAVLANHGWDTSLKKGDFVCLSTDGTTPHIYEVREHHPRIIMDHELFNSPSLLAKGFKPGDELPPLLVVRRVRDAPGYQETRVRHTIERKIDADLVVKVTLDQIQVVIDNLNALRAQILERNPDGDPICEG
jgi:hypothetical protein